MKKINILSISAILSCIALSGCADKNPSLIDGDFGVKLNQPAGVLTVTGYNDDYTLMTITPPHPSSVFQTYSVNVDKDTKTEYVNNEIPDDSVEKSRNEQKDQRFNDNKKKYTK